MKFWETLDVIRQKSRRKLKTFANFLENHDKINNDAHAQRLLTFWIRRGSGRLCACLCPFVRVFYALRRILGNRIFRLPRVTGFHFLNLCSPHSHKQSRVPFALFWVFSISFHQASLSRCGLIVSSPVQCFRQDDTSQKRISWFSDWIQKVQRKSTQFFYEESGNERTENWGEEARRKTAIHR